MTSFGARKGKLEVVVNVYDLHPSNQYSHGWGLGLFHSGVQINGTEYTFGAGGGVFSHTAKEAPGAIFRESVSMGTFEGPAQEVQRVVDKLRDEFPGTAYNVIYRNCNTFTNELCLALVNKPIPGYINRMAYLASWVSCLLPREVTNSAPVDEREAAKATLPASVSRQTGTVTAFGGSGHSLGSSSAPALDRDSLRERRLQALSRQSNES